MIKLIKQLVCEHFYSTCTVNPFIDQHGFHSAIYTCEKCGHRVYKTFKK